MFACERVGDVNNVVFLRGILRIGGGTKTLVKN